MQKVVHSENLLENARARGTQFEELLRTRLTGPNAASKRYVADIRGGGLFWGVEFQADDETCVSKLGGRRYGVVLQEIAMEKGLVIIGMTGTVDGTKGDHAILAPPLNVTAEEIEKIVDLFVDSVDTTSRLLA